MTRKCKPWIFLFLCVFISFLHSCSQVNHTISRGFAFSKQQIRGMNRTDEQGHPVGTAVRTDYFIYLECTADSRLQIDSVKYGDELFSFSVFKVNQLPVRIGNQSGKKGALELQPAAHKELWKLELHPTPADEDRQLLFDELKIHGKVNGRPFTWKTNAITMIEPDASY